MPKGVPNWQPDDRQEYERRRERVVASMSRRGLRTQAATELQLARGEVSIVLNGQKTNDASLKKLEEWVANKGLGEPLIEMTPPAVSLTL